LNYWCDWCETEHTTELSNYSMKRDEKKFIEEILKLGLIHVFISKETKLCRCGAQLECHILPVPGPAHPRTPVTGHKGVGCIGPWIHNVELMKFHGLEAKPLPCEDSYCNEVFKDKDNKKPV